MVDGGKGNYAEVDGKEKVTEGRKAREVRIKVEGLVQRKYDGWRKDMMR